MLAALESVAVVVAAQPQVPPGAWAAVAVARQVCAQDVQVTPDGTASLRHGVARDRRSSVEDTHMATAARRGRP